MTIGQRITEIRKKKKITQKEFAESINISETALCNIETGKNMPSATVLLNIYHEYKISPNYILLGEENDDRSIFNQGDNAVIGNYNDYNNSELIKTMITSLKETISDKTEQIRLQNEIIELLKKK